MIRNGTIIRTHKHYANTIDIRRDVEQLKTEDYTGSLSASDDSVDIHVNTKETHPLSLMVYLIITAFIMKNQFKIAR